MPQETATADGLVERVAGLLSDPGRLADMGRMARTLAGGNPAAEIAARILRAVGAGGAGAASLAEGRRGDV
jgi:UDP-N-acetylglucosamine:LPS N-acetylglucosamine transferase